MMLDNNAQSKETEAQQAIFVRLADRGYRPARVVQLLLDGKYSKTVELCKEYMAQHPKQISVRLTYARALYFTGQVESASEQFYLVLTQDSNNCAALKYLGDIKFSEGDEIGAMSNYQRILNIDPFTTGLRSVLSVGSKQRKQTIKLVHGKEENLSSRSRPLPAIPFYTETLGDLYCSQGHSRLASKVFKRLSEDGDNPRILQKLSDAEAAYQEKER